MFVMAFFVETIRIIRFFQQGDTVVRREKKLFKTWIEPFWFSEFELQPEFQKCWDVFFLNLNKMKTKRLSNHMSPYFIHNRT